MSIQNTRPSAFPSVEEPRSGVSKPRESQAFLNLGRNRKPHLNAESLGWVFLRISGLLLIGLIAFHIITNVLMGDGVRQINFAFVAGKWANPFSQILTFLLLILAVAHGATGVRTVIQDYVQTHTAQKILTAILHIAAAALFILGTLVLFTFNPCPPSAPAHLLPDFCPV